MSLSSPDAALDNMMVLNALGLKPGDVSVGLAAASAMLRRGDGMEALRMYATLALCEPTNINIQLGLAECSAALDLHDLAIQAAAVIISMAPNDPRGYFLSGRACLMAGYHAEAEEDLGRAAILAREHGESGIASEVERLLMVRAALPAA